MQEPRSKRLEPFAVRFLCAFAALREKREKRKETRDKKQESADRQISLRLCGFASKKKKETRDKRQETRTKRQEARVCWSLDFFAPLRLCERKEKKRQETRSKSLLTVRFLCACPPRRTGLRGFASKKTKIKSEKISQVSWLSHLWVLCLGV